MDPVRPTSALGPSPQSSARQASRDDFMKLLLAQLGNQDPTSPADGQAFIAQLAQFSSLELLESLGARLDALLIAEASMSQLAVASLVGTEVVYRSSEVELPAEGPARFIAHLDHGAQDVTAVLFDSSGRQVRTLRLGPRGSGDATVEWDGRDSNGARVPSGRYRVQLTASGPQGDSLPVEARASALATGVGFAGQAPELILGSARVRLSDVVEVHQS